MKISLNLLKKYTQITKDTVELAELISQRLGEVEDVVDLSKKYAGITIAEIKEVAEHPDAEKLNIYKIDTGKGEYVQVIAGDKTLKPGDKVAYFAPGVKIPYNTHPEKYDGIVSEVNLRGVKSCGMLASARELDISNNHEYVLRLDADARVGTSFAERYDLNDIIMDVENKALTNRPECFGIVGYAREVAGIQGLPFKTPEWFDYSTDAYMTCYASDLLAVQGEKIVLNVENVAEELCPRYMAIALRDVSVGPSPLWLQVELARSGIRPVNNVVDITNYLMILTGQPMHAFDMKQVGCSITVRKAERDETLVLINGDSKKLDETMVVITDSKSPIGVGGVMGGLHSEISSDTTDIIIECANFNMTSIRRTSNKLGVVSDASMRYSRNQDPEMCKAVLYKCVAMLKEITGAKVSSDIYDIYKYPREKKQICVDRERLQILLGLDLTNDQITKTLENVELHCEVRDDELLIDVPLYRQDLAIPEDIYEEVARLNGYSQIPLTLPVRTITPTSMNPVQESLKKTRHALAQLGACEIMTYSFVGKDYFKKACQNINLAYHLINPLSPELEYMRTSIMPSILEKTVVNMQNGYENIALFEMNKCHIKGSLDAERLPYEWRMCSLVLSLSDKESAKYQGSPYYQAKRYLEALLETLRCKHVKYESIDEIEGKDAGNVPVWVRNIQALYKKNESAIVTYQLEDKKYYLGIVGNLATIIKRNFNLPAWTCGFEINSESLQEIINTGKPYSEVSRYPKVIQDLCFIADADVPYTAVENSIINEMSKDTDITCKIYPVDIYMPDDDSGNKQLTIRVVLQNRAKVLDAEDIDYLRKRMIRIVLQTCGAKLKE